MSMRQNIIDVCKTGSVSFAELSNKIPGFSGGDSWLGIDEKNIWFWVGMTREASDSISDLVKDGKIKMTACSPMIYMYDGMCPRMDVAKQFRAYKEPRWQPVVLDVVGEAQ